MMMMMMLIGSLLLFFSFFWDMYMYMNPLATQKQQVGIDDDMNNVNKGTFWHSLLFFSLFFRYLPDLKVPGYLPRGIPPR